MNHRTKARGVTLLLLIGLAAVVATTAGAGKPPPPIIFPVVGPTQYSDDFGQPRPGGPHQGNDILAPRKALAVAAEAGTVKFWTKSASAGCMLYLYGASGTMYEYIHLNNDLTNGNDNRGKCVAGTAYAPGLKDGAKVAAGQRLGFVGDSGDANRIHPHLHFEVHPGGASAGAVDPYPFLQAAQHLLFSVPNGTVYELSLAGKVVSERAGQLSVAVSALKEWTTGRAAKQVGRTIVLTVPVDASIESAPSKGRPGRDLELAQAKKGMHVLVWTQPDVSTLAAERGDDNELSAALVILYLPD